MHDRSQQLAIRTAQQVRDFKQVVRGLSSERLARPCQGEKEGDTLAILIMRSTAVYDRLTTILDALRAHEAARPARGARPPARPATPARGRPQVVADPHTLATRLEGRGLALAERLRGLTAEQLARPLPMTVEGFDHMDKPVGMIVEYLLYCQADRLETIRLAAVPTRTPARDPHLAPSRWTPRLCQNLEEHAGVPATQPAEGVAA